MIDFNDQVEMTTIDENDSAMMNASEQTAPDSPHLDPVSASDFVEAAKVIQQAKDFSQQPAHQSAQNAVLPSQIVMAAMDKDPALTPTLLTQEDAQEQTILEGIESGTPTAPDNEVSNMENDPACTPETIQPQSNEEAEFGAAEQTLNSPIADSSPHALEPDIANDSAIDAAHTTALADELTHSAEEIADGVAAPVQPLEIADTESDADAQGNDETNGGNSRNQYAAAATDASVTQSSTDAEPSFSKTQNEIVEPAANPAYSIASKFNAQGFPLLPLYGLKGDKCTCGNTIESKACKAGKHPRPINGVKGASVKKSVVDIWFKYTTAINYGVATGHPIDNTDMMLVVIDIDWYKEDGRQTFDDLEMAGYIFPDTVEVLTRGGGRHLYYMAKTGTKFAGTAGVGIEIKGMGGYVVGPGSLHKSGKRYEFEASSDLFDGQEMALLPQWMYDKFEITGAPAAPALPLTTTAPRRADDVTDEEMTDYKADLEKISPLDRGTWIQGLMALKSRSDSEQMFALADWWSQKEGYEGVDAVRRTWNSIKPEGGITIKTLKRLAAAANPINDVDTTKLLENCVGISSSGEIKWSEPDQITFGGDVTPYPLEVLPEMLKAAVVEVQAFTKAPVAMVACSAVSTLSLAAQALYDVQRAEGLTGPISLFFLTVANSGERKTTMDGMFSAPIQEYETRCATEAKTSISEYTADFAAWEAKRKGILDRISREAKESKTSMAGNELRSHEIQQPLRPLVPRLVYGDVTPEALKHLLAVEWPSGGIISSEGGAVFGGHGMKKDNQMGNMATLNELWDGKPGRTDRRTTQAVILKSARLTVAIQVQEATLKAFLGTSNALARGTGFLARFLTAWPATTMGTRSFTEPPEAWPMRDRFHKRIAEILNAPQPIVDRELKPDMLTLTKEAKAAWVAFHNEIELQLGLTGSYHAVCDVASKAADNAVRLAALFHVLEGPGGAISLANMSSASRIVRWHLSESFRLYGDLTVPKELEAAAKLNAWLIAYCKKEGVDKIAFKNLMQFGPNDLRKKAVLEVPLNQLAGLGRIVISPAPSRIVHLNPALLA